MVPSVYFTNVQDMQLLVLEPVGEFQIICANSSVVYANLNWSLPEGQAWCLAGCFINIRLPPV
jgi:hypothetical protein